MIAPPPSPRTNPSRVESNGLDAVVRVIVPRGQCLEGIEPSDAAFRDCGLRSTRDHHVGLAQSNVIERVNHRIRATRTRRNRAEVWASVAVAHADVTRRNVRDHHWE